MAEMRTDTAATEAGGRAPRPLGTSEREAAAQALVRAFWDDPLMTYIWPSDALRRTLLPIFMRGAIQLAAPQRETFTAEPDPIGAALWLPPGKAKIPTPRVLRILAPNIWRWRPGPLTRFMRVLDELDRKHIKYDHWYLMVLGVDPPKQGQGYGGVLMSDVLRRADEQGLEAYLETQKARNLPFYEKHGFAVVEHFYVDNGRGPESWTMLRKPRA